MQSSISLSSKSIFVFLLSFWFIIISGNEDLTFSAFDLTGSFYFKKSKYASFNLTSKFILYGSIKFIYF
jgi:hypothetical protein